MHTSDIFLKYPSVLTISWNLDEVGPCIIRFVRDLDDNLT